MNLKRTVLLDEAAINSVDKAVIRKYDQDDFITHDHIFFELVYILEGTTIHTLNGVSGKLSAGDYFIVDFGSQHSYSDSKNLKLINCLFLPEIIDDTLTGCHSFEELLHVCLLRYYKLFLGKTSADHIFHDTNGHVLQLLNGMLDEFEEKNVGYAEIFRNRLLEIIIIIMRNVIDHGPRIKNDMILDAIKYINRNFSKTNLLAQFCSQSHYSPQYVSRKFKSETGFTFSEYLQKIRIEKSCELLSDSSLSISEIAGRAGYTDIKSFNSLFKRIIKMTPGAYRKLMH